MGRKVLAFIKYKLLFDFDIIVSEQFVIKKFKDSHVKSTCKFVNGSESYTFVF